MVRRGRRTGSAERARTRQSTSPASASAPIASCAASAAAAWARCSSPSVPTSNSSNRSRSSWCGAGCCRATLQGRLKLERQILATLDHPNIARLFDGGTTTDGTPYIVMEYVDGEPIDIYCDSRQLRRRAAAAAVPGRVLGGAPRAPEPDRAPRPEAIEHPGHARRRRRSCSTSASPRCSTTGT